MQAIVNDHASKQAEPSDDDKASDAPGSEGADDGDQQDHAGLSEKDVESIEESARLNALMIYEILRREGEEEMNRHATSLWWSGVAAGLSISFSLIAQAVLQSHLPDAPWRPLLTSLGYTVGFLIAVLARHQLFTENTITPVLPVLADLTVKNLGRMGRLWGVVLVANFAGTLIAAAFCTFTPLLSPELKGAMLEISRHTMQNTPVEMFVKAIGAGFLIAGMVWLIPSAAGAQFHVIVLMTYLIAAAGFTHIIAGSFEAFMLILGGQAGVWPTAAGFALPTLLGNIIGGTALFSLISYGQVAKEM